MSIAHTIKQPYSAQNFSREKLTVSSGALIPVLGQQQWYLVHKTTPVIFKVLSLEDADHRLADWLNCSHSQNHRYQNC